MFSKKYKNRQPESAFLEYLEAQILKIYPLCGFDVCTGLSKNTLDTSLTCFPHCFLMFPQLFPNQFLWVFPMLPLVFHPVFYFRSYVCLSYLKCYTLTHNWTPILSKMCLDAQTFWDILSFSAILYIICRNWDFSSKF